MYSEFMAIESSTGDFTPNLGFKIIGHEGDQRPVNINGATLIRREHADHVRVIDRKAVRAWKVVELLGGLQRLVKAGMPGY